MVVLTFSFFNFVKPKPKSIRRIRKKKKNCWFFCSFVFLAFSFFILSVLFFSFPTSLPFFCFLPKEKSFSFCFTWRKIFFFIYIRRAFIKCQRKKICEWFNIRMKGFEDELIGIILILCLRLIIENQIFLLWKRKGLKTDVRLGKKKSHYRKVVLLVSLSCSFDSPRTWLQLFVGVLWFLFFSVFFLFNKIHGFLFFFVHGFHLLFLLSFPFLFFFLTANWLQFRNYFKRNKIFPKNNLR